MDYLTPSNRNQNHLTLWTQNQNHYGLFNSVKPEPEPFNSVKPKPEPQCLCTPLHRNQNRYGRIWLYRVEIRTGMDCMISLNSITVDPLIDSAKQKPEYMHTLTDSLSLSHTHIHWQTRTHRYRHTDKQILTDRYSYPTVSQGKPFGPTFLHVHDLILKLFTKAAVKRPPTPRPPPPPPPPGAGIAQWLERRTRDWKVAGSNPCWNGGRIFFSRVDFLCWLLFRYPFHPRVTTVARKKIPVILPKVQVAGYS